MAESDARVNLFLEDIDRDALERRDAIKAEVNEYMKAQLAAEEEKARQQAEAILSAERDRARVEANRQFAAINNRAKFALSRRRMEIKESVFEQAREELRSFVDSDAYAAFLRDSVAGMADAISGDAVILVREQDLPLADQLKAAFGRPCGVEADRSIGLGGCKIKDTTNGLIADDTLEVRLNAQEEWFLANAKLPVNIAGEVR